MNILLTGATGFLGYRILEVLVNNPKIKLIIANGRSLMPSRRVTHNKVKYFLGDLSKIDFVHSLPNDIDVVINTASLSSPWGNRELFYKSIQKTYKRIDKCENSKTIHRLGLEELIWVNILNVFGNSEIIKEEFRKKNDFQKILADIINQTITYNKYENSRNDSLTLQ